MKKTLLFTLGLMATLISNAQTPQVTLTYEDDPYTLRTIVVGSSDNSSNVVSVDWGNGTIVPSAKNDTLRGVVTGPVKIYSVQALTALTATSNPRGTGLVGIDLSQAPELASLNLQGNKFAALDLRANAKLNRVVLNDNLLTSIQLPTTVTYLNLEGNKLTAFDPAGLPELTYLRIGLNQLTSLDVSRNLKLASLYANENKLSTFKLGPNAQPNLVVNLWKNELTSLDLRGAAGIGRTGSRLFVHDNQLTEILYDSLATANLAGNRFTLATIPTARIASLTYAPQRDMAVAVDGLVIDLSSQATVAGQTTTFKWYRADRTVIDPSEYTEQNGRFTFNQAIEGAFCAMTNPAFPRFTTQYPFKTVGVTFNPSSIDKATLTDAPADVYTLGGMLLQRNADLNSLPAGTYVVKQGNRVTKVAK